MKGSSGFMYGFGSPGGIINYVTKKPIDTPVRSVDIDYKSDSLWSEHIDWGGRAGDDARFGYRLNATQEEGTTYNDGRLRRDSLSLALDARLMQDLLWDFGALAQNRHSSGQTPSISTRNLVGGSLPSVVSGADQSLLSAGQHLANNLQFYSTGLHYRLGADWSLSTSTSYSHSTADRTRNEGILYLKDSAGDYDDDRSDSHEAHRFDQWQAMLQGNLRTGPVQHQVVLGASWQKQVNFYSSNSVYQQIGIGNIHQPNTNSYFSATDFSLYRDSDIAQRAVVASDTVHLSEHWSVLAGIRDGNFQQNGYDLTGARSSQYDKNGVITPTLALLFKPVAEATLYASYVESLEQGASVGIGYASYRDQLAPLTSKQYELGAKTERLGWSATAALFRIERGAEYANSANELVQDGQSIYQGIELGASTQLGSQWLLAANLMALDTAYQHGSANEGHRVAGAPDVVATAQLAYTVAHVPGLELSAGAKYIGNTQLDAANSVRLPGHTLVNLGARYATRFGNHDTVFHVAVNNLADRRYWQFQYENYIPPADPRTFSAGATVSF